MKFSKTIVFGCGGTGSHLIPNLTRFRMFAGHEDPLVLIDGDVVEYKNLERQAFGAHTVDRQEMSKTEAAAVLAFDVNPRVKLELVNRYLYGKEDLYQHLLSWKERGSQPDECVMIFNCVDNNKSRKIVYDAVMDVGVPAVVIDCGNDLFTGNVNTWFYVKDEPMPFVCPLDKWQSLREPTDRAPGESCTEAAPATPQLITANMMAAVLALHQYMKISAIGETSDRLSLIHEEIRFDLEESRVQSIGEHA